jgi:hypothetical protein
MARWLDGLARQIAQSDATAVGVTVAIGAALATAAAWYAWRGLHKARVIEDLPTSKARSAHQGYVELEGIGRALDDTPLAAPISRLPCLWYRYRVEEEVTHQEHGRQHRHWRTVDAGESDATFLLEDDTGRVVVDPAGAEVSTRAPDTWQSGAAGASILGAPAFVTGFVARRGHGRYRFREWRIAPGEKLYALGLLRNLGAHANAPALAAELRERLREWKRDQPALLARFDLDKNGRLDEKEWMLARAQARREIERARAAPPPATEGLNLLGATRDPDRPFLISCVPQTELTRRYRRRAALAAAGFLALGAATVWVYGVRFG